MNCKAAYWQSKNPRILNRLQMWNGPGTQRDPPMNATESTAAASSCHLWSQVLTIPARLPNQRQANAHACLAPRAPIQRQIPIQVERPRQNLINGSQATSFWVLSLPSWLPLSSRLLVLVLRLSLICLVPSLPVSQKSRPKCSLP